MGPNQTYKLFHGKGNHKQNEKTVYGMGEKILVNYVTDKDLISKINGLYNSKTSKQKQVTQLKNGQKT